MIEHTDNKLESYNAAFKVSLERLNPAQLQAVEQTEGPVLVLAGPGTGKTQVLASRIGQILLKTDTRPNNILCLTFTDAGVYAMRQRLLQLIGPEAHKVPIQTYHSFCNKVIQENLEYFGRADMEPISDLERIDLIRGLLDPLPPEHPLRKEYKTPYQFERQLRKLFQNMKTEGWTPGFLHKKVNDWLQQLPEHEAFIYKRDSKFGPKGSLKTEKVADETVRMDRLKAAADLYPKYISALQRSARYEYEDMLLWVLDAFKKYPPLLRTYQERYLYVLVDEYQDTNGAQNKLLELLLAYWENPNIFIVGDDDQSIYEFQGSRLRNLLDFYALHKDNLLTITLTNNYRSDQHILDLAASLIQNNALRAVNSFETPVSKDLKAMRLFPTTEAQIKVFGNRFEEDCHVSDTIAQLISSGTAPDEIAVLYAQHRQAARITQLFEKQGIPYKTKRPVNILELPLIGQLRDILAYLRDELKEPFGGEARLFKLLHAPFWGIDPLQLAETALRVQQDKSLHWRTLLHESDWPYARFLAQLPADSQAGYSLPILIERIINQSGMLAFVLQLPDKAWFVQVLTTFLQFVSSEGARNKRLDLQRLLDLMDTMDDHRVPLGLQQSVQTNQPTDTKGAVQLLTAHASKGLEFEHVFIIDATQDYWEPGGRDGAGRFPLPPTVTLSGEEDAVEARRRLFYVAITRAKSHLHISYAQADDAGKPLTQARFTDEIPLPHITAAVQPERLLSLQTLLLREQSLPVVTLPPAVLEADFLQNFALSITHLNRYLRCPLAFYYEDILRIPTTQSEAATFGHAMHNTLQQYFGRMQRDKKHEWPDADTLLRLFKKEMEANKGHFSIQGYTQRLALGTHLLGRYWKEQIPYWYKRAKVEFRLDRVQVGDALLTGVLDKIEYIDSTTVRITDYKTGTPKKEKTAAPNEQQPNGGDYWRQLAFYKILLEASGLFSERADKTMISWLEPDAKGKLLQHDVTFTTDEVAWMRDLIQSVYTRIQAREFTTGCGAADCAWCTMHRDHTMHEVVVKLEEDLDDGG